MGSRLSVMVYILSVVWKIISFSSNRGNLMGVFLLCCWIVIMVIVSIYSFSVFVK